MDFACPSCGERLDAHTDTAGTDAVPSEGDALFCIYCGTWLISEGTGARFATEEEIDEILQDPVARRAVQLFTLLTALKAVRDG